MNDSRLLRIANRINLLLLRQLGQGIDVKRFITEPLYARDVFLVCEAEPGSDLDSLARHFRIALAEPVDDQGQPSSFGAPSSSFDTGFGTAPPPLPDSIAGALPPAPATEPPRSRLARWLGR